MASRSGTLPPQWWKAGLKLRRAVMTRPVLKL